MGGPGLPARRQPLVAGGLGRECRVTNRKGLHARASAKLVQGWEQFDADVSVTRCGETVGGTSIMGLLTLAAAQGTTITVQATGAQAKEALEALCEAPIAYVSVGTRRDQIIGVDGAV